MVGYVRAPDPHLHPCRRRRHDRARRLLPGAQDLPRLAAYADVDETNAAIGVAIALGQLPEELSGLLRKIQNDLFDIGADLCTPIVPDPKYPPLRVAQSYVDRLEGWCDQYNADLRR